MKGFSTLFSVRGQLRSNIFFTLCAALLVVFTARARNVSAAPTERGFQIPVDQITTQHLDDLINNWHINIIRVQIGSDTGMDGVTGAAYESLMNDHFNLLDTKLPLLQARGLKMIFCLYSPPGGFESRVAPSHYTMFSRSDLQADFVRMWQTIATRYGSNETISAFDLVNEPAARKSLLGAGVKSWGQLALTTVGAIRSITSKPIIIKSLYGDPSKLVNLPAIPYANISYSYNAYFYHSYQTTGITTPARSVQRPTDSAILARVRGRLAPFFKKTYDRVLTRTLPASAYPPKLVVGEVAVAACALEPGAFLTGLLTALETDDSSKGAADRARVIRGWKRLRRRRPSLPTNPPLEAADFVQDVAHSSYAVHAYNEAPVWDPRVSCNESGQLYSPPTEAEQAIVIKSFFSRN